MFMKGAIDPFRGSLDSNSSRSLQSDAFAARTPCNMRGFLHYPLLHYLPQGSACIRLVCIKAETGATLGGREFRV